MAKVKGIQTIKEHVEIEVNKKELLEGIWEELKKKYKSLDEFNYIDYNTGKCMVYSDTDYHTGEDDYDPLRLATDIEIEIHQTFDKIRQLLNG